jgi:Flp pilus assembly protein TadG
VLVVTFAMVLGTARVGDAVLRRHRAQLVADVAALAAVAGEATAADRIARSNGAVVRAVTVAEDGTVVVTVELDGARAVAAAAPGG